MQIWEERDRQLEDSLTNCVPPPASVATFTDRGIRQYGGPGQPSSIVTPGSSVTFQSHSAAIADAIIIPTGFWRIQLSTSVSIAFPAAGRYEVHINLIGGSETNHWQTRQSFSTANDFITGTTTKVTSAPGGVYILNTVVHNDLASAGDIHVIETDTVVFGVAI